MLSVAKALCLSLLFGDSDPQTAREMATSGGAPIDVEPVWYTPDKSGKHLRAASNLFTNSGDAEFWLKTCSLDNQPPVRALYGSVDDGTFHHGIQVDVDQSNRLFSVDLFSAENYDLDQNGSPEVHPVGNDRGTVDQGITPLSGHFPTNLQPYCYRPGTSSVGPTCPPTIGSGNWRVIDSAAEATGNPSCGKVNNPNAPNPCWGSDEADRWATRGAINAGLVVYLYLQAVSQGTLTPLPPNDRCDLLMPQQ